MNKNIKNQIDELRTRQKVRCTKPWTSLEERSVSGDYKVCCFIKRAIGHIDKLSDRDIMELRNTTEVQDLRSSIKNDRFGNWCPFGCPILHLRNQLFESQEFWDYDPEEYNKFSDAFRENRARMISDILEGKIELNTYPVRLKLYPSDFCNIDCRMCDLEKTNVVEVGDTYF
ncbi:MAG: hypothetical protein A3D21_02535 [Nitrospirae bacterium RIFCSPHIGHO2_02_FULL_42_12]|nr:MAG: hypothetical protein A3D21_02535 [Nitrospirae bacterium RIFCSPHIGHO2_02_FULL_42_12]